MFFFNVEMSSSTDKTAGTAADFFRNQAHTRFLYSYFLLGLLKAAGRSFLPVLYQLKGSEFDMEY